MRTVDIVKTLEADIDRFERDLSNIRTKLQYSYILLDRISRKEQKEASNEKDVPEIRKETR